MTLLQPEPSVANFIDERRVSMYYLRNRELNRAAIPGKALFMLQPILMCRVLYRAAILG